MIARIGSFLASFRARLIVGYVVVLGVFVALWAWSLFGPLTQASIDQQRADLVTVARIAALNSRDTAPADAARSIARASESDLRVTIVAPDGTVLADSADDPVKMENHKARPEIAAALRGEVGSAMRRSATLGTEQIYVAVPATVGGRAVVLRVSEPLARVRGLADSGRQTGLGLLVLALAVAIVVAYRLSARAAEPVRRLRDAAEAMAAGDLTAPVPATDGELGDLARSITALRDRIRSTIADLAGNEAMLRAALDGMSDAVFLLEGERIAYANRASGGMFRPMGAARRGQTFAEAGLPESLVALVRAGTSGVPVVHETGPDPEGRYFRMSVVPLDPGDGEGRTLLVVADATGSGRFDAMRRDFVANASHELKTPVAAIKLLSEAAASAAYDGDTGQALAFVAQIHAEAERLRRLIGDLLDLARIEHRRADTSLVDVRIAIGNALAAHHASASDAGLSLEAACDSVAGHDVYAVADPTDLAVALDNLLANAIAYTESGGVTICLEADEERVHITVTDTGPGIAPEHLPRIFERFYRVDAARSRATGGTGLGLALVRNAVEASGGSVDVVSEPGSGTAFRLTLRRAH